jgi:hypothetical protein
MIISKLVKHIKEHKILGLPSGAGEGSSGVVRFWAYQDFTSITGINLTINQNDNATTSYAPVNANIINNSIVLTDQNGKAVYTGATNLFSALVSGVNTNQTVTLTGIPQAARAPFRLWYLIEQSNQPAGRSEAPKFVTKSRIELLNATYVDQTGDTMTGELIVPTFKTGNVAGGNYTEFEADGTMKMVGDSTTWDDLRTPINNTIRVSGRQPAEQVYRAGIVYSFSKISDNTIAFNVQMPHSYKLGTDIGFHIHYIMPTSGAGGGTAENIKWDFTHSWADIDSAQPSETTVSATIDVKDKTADTHYLGGIAASIDGSGISKVSSMIICSLTRDVSVGDNYDDVVYLMEVDFHYQLDTVGSRQQTVK